MDLSIVIIPTIFTAAIVSPHVLGVTRGCVDGLDRTSHGRIGDVSRAEVVHVRRVAPFVCNAFRSHIRSQQVAENQCIITAESQLVRRRCEPGAGKGINIAHKYHVAHICQGPYMPP